VAIDTGNLAYLFHIEGRYEDAESLFQQSISIFKNIDVISSGYAFFSGAFSEMLFEKGQFGEADLMCNQALEFRNKITTKRFKSEMAHLLRVLAEIDVALNKLNEAEMNARKVLEMFKSTPNHFDIAESLIVLVKVLHANNDDESALTIGKQGLDIFERVLGPDNPRTIKAKKKIASLLNS
jgi:ATP/maltotriose-dependent transcriptional regulator MalT